MTMGPGLVLSVVVPVYNEQALVRASLERLRALPIPLQVICVDDASTDGSPELAAGAGAVVVRHPINLGQGAALQTGITHALRDPGVDYVVTFDADGQHQVADAVCMVERLARGEADVVFGSRFLDQRTEAGWLRTTVLRVAMAYSNATTGVHLTDTHNGLRAFNRSVASRLDLRQNRMAHASEIITQVGAMKARYVEQPVHILSTDYSRRKGQHLLNSVNIIAEMIYK
jgi:glycosyltransferase involved in cell wall biosynthesis